MNEADSDEQPQPYIYSKSGEAPSVKCRVCQNLLNLEGKLDYHVTKCEKCNEATVGSKNSCITLFFIETVFLKTYLTKYFVEMLLISFE